MDSESRKEFHEFARRDRYYRWCKLESPDSGSGERFKKLCRACLWHHSKIFFSADQLAKPPERRICRGREGIIQLGPRLRYSLADLQDRLPQWHPIFQDYNIYVRDDWQDTRLTDFNDHPCEITASFTGTTGSAGVCIKIVHCVPAEDSHHTLTESLRQFIDRGELRPFPHDRLKSLKFWDHASYNCIIEAACRIRQCYTTVVAQVYRPEDSEVDLIIVQVHRNVGDVEDATNPRWLAQIE
ncbi:MAG: hypothetical protein M1820_009046 [Bogoriella megaspora]|nr:MAG: hypothetical protein M1820_009046 [Bogoriella megaspora]